MILRSSLAIFLCYVQLSSEEEIFSGTIPINSYRSDSNGPVSYMHFTRGNAVKPLVYLHPQTFFYHPITSLNRNDKKPLAVEDEEKHVDSYSKSEGEKGRKGYRKTEQVDKSSKGEFDKEKHQSDYGENGGNSNGHHDGSHHYESHHKSGGGYEGGRFGENSGHKSGEKTTGYEKKIRKDEYKKMHTFYDEADRSGSFEKYGSGHSRHSSENGGQEDGGSSDAGYQEEEKGKEGSYSKGHHEKQDSEFEGEEGRSQHHQHHSDYARDKGKEGEEEHGHEEK